MFEFVFLIVFTLILAIANVYCFVKKKYLYLFVPCMLFLPSYYAFDLGERLPLVTITRLMFVVFYIYALINKRRKIDLRGICTKKVPKKYALFVGYFLLRIVSNMYYVTTYSEAIKTIFGLIFEQLLLVTVFYMLDPTKKEIHTLINVVISVATCMFVIGIAESVFSIRPFDALYTVDRIMGNAHLKRLGLFRATTTMMAPPFFANMCILMLPLIGYMFRLTNSKKYILITVLDVLAIIHAGSRANILYLFLLIIVYAFIYRNDRDILKSFVKNVFIIVTILSIYIGFVSCISAELKYFYVGNAKSVLNEVGFNFDLNEGAPDGVKGYGGNVYGTASRTRQFTGVYYAAKINPVFGLGSKAWLRGDLFYYWRNDNGTDNWRNIKACDVGIVEILTEEGIIGFVGVCALFAYMMIESRKSKTYQFALICYLLSTFSSINMFSFLMMYLCVFSGLLMNRKE